MDELPGRPFRRIMARNLVCAEADVAVVLTKYEDGSAELQAVRPDVLTEAHATVRIPAQHVQLLRELLEPKAQNLN